MRLTKDLQDKFYFSLKKVSKICLYQKKAVPLRAFLWATLFM